MQTPPDTADDAAHTDPVPPSDSAPVILDRARALDRAHDLLDYVDASPMPYLAAAETTRRLVAAGYRRLEEGAAWDLEPGGGYFLDRNGSTVVAFRLGTRPPADTGVSAVGAHLDSPNLRIKPRGGYTQFGHRQLAAEMYGGALLATWTDRDLGLSGRVVLRADGVSGEARWPVETRLVRVDRPVARVPNLAIHLNRGVNNDGLQLDRQTQVLPLVGMDSLGDGSHWGFREWLAGELDVAADRILDYDLGLHDVTPSVLGGLDQEFIFAPRLDNLGSSHAGLVALLEQSGSVEAPETSWLLALYDHEEVGSQSLQGAQGNFVAEVVRRMASGHPDASGDDLGSRTLARSYLVSADMSHALHPNYASYSETTHRPLLNRGPAIKRNDNQRYATDGESSARFRELCRAAGFEAQDYVHRSDLPCGSTIGPMTAAGVGIKTVDVGCPMLSMHSVREMAGTFDHDLMIEALRRLYR